MSTAQEVRLVVKYFGPLLRKKEVAQKFMQSIETLGKGAASSPLPQAPSSSKTRSTNPEKASTRRSYSTDARSAPAARTPALSSSGSLTSHELTRFLGPALRAASNA